MAERRRFLLSDTMILVAAVAIGAALARAPLAHLRIAARYAALGWLYEGISVVSPAVAALSLVLPILRLRPPCPPRRRLLGQPGFVACLAAAVALLVASAAALPPALSRINTPEYGMRMNYLCSLVADKTGFSVLGAWMMLALSGRWRAERSWIDRLGRAVGIYWLAVNGLNIVETWAEVM